MANPSLKIMVVDDSMTYRMIVRKAAEAISGMEVVEFAPNGRVALEKLHRTAVDVLLLDVEMPEMDGLTTLRHVVADYPAVAVVMVSGTSHSNANIVVECLNLGAFDFVTKPLESDVDLSREALRANLQPILAVLAKRTRRSRPLPVSSARPVVPAPAPVPVEAKESVQEQEPLVQRTPAGVATGHPPPARGGVGHPVRQAAPAAKTLHWDKRPALLLIGASTGGPAALTRVLSGMTPNFPIPTMIVQHMPPMFTTSLAAQLTRSTGHLVQEAEHDREITPGKILLAPGGRHLSVKKVGPVLKSVLHDGPKVNGCRPAVDVLLLSVMAFFDAPVLAVILTGMGNDGANGVKGLKRLGRTFCITQSKDSCVVYGMPRAVEEMGLSDASVALEQVGANISLMCR